jgi:hypothetical protein
MKPPLSLLRQAFGHPHYLFVKIVPQGFLLDDQPLRELRGRLRKIQLLRKRFEEGFLVCDSPDGLRARDGTLCDTCRHAQCRPQLRLHLAEDSFLYVMDLATTSARNLLHLEACATTAGETLESWDLKLTVVDRGHWGEVCFDKL